MLDICFPIGAIFLMLATNWPFVILYNLGFTRLPSQNISFIVGLFVNSIILFTVGWLVDRSAVKKYFIPYKISIVLASFILYVVLFLLAWIGWCPK